MAHIARLHNQHDELQFLLLHARLSIREEGKIFPYAPVPKNNLLSAKIPKRLMAGERFRRRIFSLACDMEEPLDQALAFARTLDLMGFGLCNIAADDHGPSFVAIAEAMTDRLKTAKKDMAANPDGERTEREAAQEAPPCEPQATRNTPPLIFIMILCATSL